MNNYDVSRPNCYDVYKLLLLATGVHFKRPMGTWCCMISHASPATCCHMCHRPRVVTCVIDCSFCRQPWRKRTSARNAAQKHPPEVFALPQAWWSLQQRDLLRFAPASWVCLAPDGSMLPTKVGSAQPSRSDSGHQRWPSSKHHGSLGCDVVFHADSAGGDIPNTSQHQRFGGLLTNNNILVQQPQIIKWRACFL